MRNFYIKDGEEAVVEKLQYEGWPTLCPGTEFGRSTELRCEDREDHGKEAHRSTAALEWDGDSLQMRCPATPSDAVDVLHVPGGDGPGGGVGRRPPPLILPWWTHSAPEEMPDREGGAGRWPPPLGVTRDDIIAFGGIPNPVSDGRQMSCRLQDQPDVDDMQLRCAMRAAKLRDIEVTTGPLHSSVCGRYSLRWRPGSIWLLDLSDRRR